MACLSSLGCGCSEKFIDGNEGGIVCKSTSQKRGSGPAIKPSYSTLLYCHTPRKQPQRYKTQSLLFPNIKKATMPPNKPHPRSLLLTLDALDTLYRPRASIATQYLNAARDHQLPLRRGVTVETVNKAFRAAYEAANKRQPIYAHKEAARGAQGGPEVWWADVIRACFQQIIAQEVDAEEKPKEPGPVPAPAPADRVPDALVRDLYERFSSAKGYDLFDDVHSFFASMRRFKKAFAEKYGDAVDRGDDGRSVKHHSSSSSSTLTPAPRIVVGVVSNSDNRIDQVLRALGLQVSQGVDNAVETQTQQQWDIDHVFTSFEAGCEKPDPAIFQRAYSKMVSLHEAHAPDRAPKKQQRQEWYLMHVGDHLEKDCKGAIAAGWDSSLLLDRDGLAGALHWDDPRIVRVRSLEDVVERLQGEFIGPNP